MFKVIEKDTGKRLTVYAVEDNRFLVYESGQFRWNSQRYYTPEDAEPEAVKVTPANDPRERDTGTGSDVRVTMSYETRFGLDAMLGHLKCGELDFSIGDFFTTRLKNGMEVDFVCTDKDEHSYRFESRDCLGRYDPMTKIDRFYNAVWDELPDVLKDNIMEIVRQYKAPDGELMERKCKLFLPSAAEIFPPDECYGDQGLYEQLEWYKDPHNRVRAYEKGGAADWYWTQSPHAGNTTFWCRVSLYGHAARSFASTTAVAAPVCFRIPRI